MRAIVLSLVLAACTPPTDKPGETPGTTPDPNRVARAITSASGDLADVVEGNNDFAWDVYGEAIASAEGNVFMSPMSMSAALGMTMAGADGDTLTEMSQVLGVQLPEPDWHGAFGPLLTDLSGDLSRGYTLHIANRLFGQVDYPWNSDFLAVCSDDYGAPLEEWDYLADPEGGRQLVNDWVEDNTQDRIEDLLPPGVISTDTRLVLANAIYFLADWATQFDVADTRDDSFTLLDGSTTTAPIMMLDTSTVTDSLVALGYVSDATVVRMPYQDDELSMYLVVPFDTDGLPAIEAQLDGPTVEGWIDSVGAPSGDIVLRMPRFEMEFDLDLVPALRSLGMVEAFDEANADLTRMHDGSEQLFVSAVRHKAFLKVDEEGTEAAAATAVVVGTESASPFVNATHPFLFLIRDDLTGSILFTGRLMNPNE